jgi:hypothetical protein
MTRRIPVVSPEECRSCAVCMFFSHLDQPFGTLTFFGLPSNATYLIVGSQISPQPTFVTYAFLIRHMLYDFLIRHVLCDFLIWHVPYASYEATQMPFLHTGRCRSYASSTTGEGRIDYRGMPVQRPGSAGSMSGMMPVRRPGRPFRLQGYAGTTSIKMPVQRPGSIAVWSSTGVLA